MNIGELTPCPLLYEPFKRNRERFIPQTSGCYVLTSFEKVVLYIGLTKDLRRRFNEHLDSPEKTNLTSHGKAILFFWLECNELNKIERTWMNTHIQFEAKYPVLNKVYSPTAV